MKHRGGINIILKKEINGENRTNVNRHALLFVIV